MKKFFYLVIFFLAQFSLGQEFSDETKNVFLNFFCSCFEENNQNGYDQENFSLCIEKEMEKHQNIFLPYFDSNSKLSEYEQGEELGKKLITEYLDEIIYNCDAYYIYYNDKNKRALNDAKNNLGKEKLQEFEEEIKTNPSSNAYLKRGFYHFAYENYESAESDLTKALELDPKNDLAKTFLGFLFENMGRLQKALEIFTEIHQSKQDQESLLQIAVINRKIKEASQK